MSAAQLTLGLGQSEADLCQAIEGLSAGGRADRLWRAAVLGSWALAPRALGPALGADQLAGQVAHSTEGVAGVLVERYPRRRTALSGLAEEFLLSGLERGAPSVEITFMSLPYAWERSGVTASTVAAFAEGVSRLDPCWCPTLSANLAVVPLTRSGEAMKGQLGEREGGPRPRRRAAHAGPHRTRNHRENRWQSVVVVRFVVARTRRPAGRPGANSSVNACARRHRHQLLPRRRGRRGAGYSR